MIRTLLSTMTVVAIAITATPIAPVESRGGEVQVGDGRHVTVFKTPWCGCCKVWTEALQAAGYTVDARDVEDLDPIKRQARVPEKLEACHTATIDGYVLEGHVPLPAIDKLLAERPKIVGISVPGMPPGSLGMGFDADARYDVYSYTSDPDVASAVFFKAGE